MTPRAKTVRLTGHTGLDVYRAAQSGDFALVKRLLAAHLKQGGRAKDFFTPDEHGDTWFDLWAETRADTLLKCVAPYRIPWTPHFAAAWGRVDVLEKFHQRDPGCLRGRNARGRTPMHCALVYNRLDAAAWLVAHGGKLSDPKAHYVWAAIRSREEAPVRFAVRHGAPVDGPPGGRTALHHECNHGWTKLVPCLLELGADPNAPDPSHDGDTPLHLAAQRGNATRLVRLLLNAGANVTARNHRGESPLDVAKRVQPRAVARLLAKSLAQPD